MFYVAESPAAVKRFRAALTRCGLNAAAKAKQGALVESTHAEAHLAGGRFDVERMMRRLNEAVDSALDDGFVGLRTCGDMSWLLQKPVGGESVVEYEAHFLDHALATHSSAIVDCVHKRNPFFRPAAIAMTRVPQPTDIDWKISELRRTP